MTRPVGSEKFVRQPQWGMGESKVWICAPFCSMVLHERRGSNGGLGLRASWLKGGGLGLQACVAADAAFHPLVCDAIHSVGRRGLAGNGFLRYQLGGRVTGGLGMRAWWLKGGGLLSRGNTPAC